MEAILLIKKQKRNMVGPRDILNVMTEREIPVPARNRTLIFHYSD